MKAELIKTIREQLADQLKRVMRAAKETQQAATDPDSKAESKYDTRNLEASYLAIGQARQVETLAKAVRMFESFSAPDYAVMGAAGPGAMVELMIQSESCWFLLVPAAGGLEIEEAGRVITLLSPESPLYQQLLGCTVDQQLDIPKARVRTIL